MRSTTVINISVPPSLADKIARQAKKEAKTKSKLLRDAFESYMFRNKLREYQKVGRVIAQKLGLETYDEIEEFLG